MNYSSLSIVGKMGENYSVDMVRLKFLLHSKSNADNLVRYIRINDGVLFNSTPIRKFVEFKYRYHYTIKTQNSVLIIEYGFDDGTREGMNKGFIEFNPNKFVYEPDYNVLCDFLRVLEYDILMDSPYCIKGEVFELGRWDLAIDFPEQRNQFYLVQDKRNYQYIKSRSGVTEYLGVRNTGGFVKLYDKTKESKLNEILTRLEITFDGYNYPTFPVMYKKKRQEFLRFGLNDTQMVLVDLLNMLEPQEKEVYFKRLGRRVQSTIKEAVYDDEEYEFDFIAISYLMDGLRSLEKGVLLDNFKNIKNEFHDSKDLPFN